MLAPPQPLQPNQHRHGVQQHGGPKGAADLIERGGGHPQQGRLQQEAGIVEEPLGPAVPEPPGQGVIKHEQPNAQGAPGQQLRPGRAFPRVGQQGPPEQQLLPQGGHRQQGGGRAHQAPRPGPGVAGLQETGTEAQGQGHRRIERETQQAEAHLAGIQGGQQAISQAALQLPHQRQAAQQQGGRQGFVAGTGAGDLVGAQDPQGGAAPQEQGREGVVAAARQDRMETQQSIEGALTALEGAHKRPLNWPRNWPRNRPRNWPRNRPRSRSRGRAAGGHPGAHLGARFGPVRRPQGGSNQIRIAVPVGAHDAEGHQHRLDGPPQGFPAGMAGRRGRT